MWFCLLEKYILGAHGNESSIYLGVRITTLDEAAKVKRFYIHQIMNEDAFHGFSPQRKELLRR